MHKSAGITTSRCWTSSTIPSCVWYGLKAGQNGWSRDVLVYQIEGRLHERQGRALTNFDRTVPPPDSDLAQDLSKSPYLF